MARIRTIKPEFPQSESVGALSRDARLLFIQLWTLVDDDGRARAASRMLASLLYPYDDDAPKLMNKWLLELEQAKQIRRYEVDGSCYLDIPNWQKHQKIDRPSPSRLPAYREPSPEPREGSRALDADLGPSTLDHGPSTDSRTVANATRPERNLKFDEFKKAYPRRKGGNPWKTARDVWDAAVKSGASPDQIIAAVKAGIGYDPDKTGTEYIPQAVKWLRDRRYQDYTPANSSTLECLSSKFYAAADSLELDAWDAHARATGGGNMPRDRNGGWYVTSRWPPGYVPAETQETTVQPH